MKQEDGFYVDENNNKWNAKSYTKEQAETCSKSLINCINCINCSDCRYCSDCINCSDCSNCINCSDCRYCSNYQKNPNRYIGSCIGSRKSQTTVYWLNDNIQVVCGCFNGNLIEFENRVTNVYHDASNLHYREYMQFIAIVKIIIKMEKEN